MESSQTLPKGYNSQSSERSGPRVMINGCVSFLYGHFSAAAKKALTGLWQISDMIICNLVLKKKKSHGEWIFTPNRSAVLKERPRSSMFSHVLSYDMD